MVTLAMAAASCTAMVLGAISQKMRMNRVMTAMVIPTPRGPKHAAAASVTSVVTRMLATVEPMSMVVRNLPTSFSSSANGLWFPSFSASSRTFQGQSVVMAVSDALKKAMDARVRSASGPFLPSAVHSAVQSAATVPDGTIPPPLAMAYCGAFHQHKHAATATAITVCTFGRARNVVRSCSWFAFHAIATPLSIHDARKTSHLRFLSIRFLDAPKRVRNRASVPRMPCAISTRRRRFWTGATSTRRFGRNQAHVRCDTHVCDERRKGRDDTRVVRGDVQTSTLPSDGDVSERRDNDDANVFSRSRRTCRLDSRSRPTLRCLDSNPCETYATVVRSRAKAAAATTTFARRPRPFRKPDAEWATTSHPQTCERSQETRTGPRRERKRTSAGASETPPAAPLVVLDESSRRFRNVRCRIQPVRRSSSSSDARTKPTL
mmetsp:Transcript_7728/g.47943  ORF Transcript_7728/g.47943 Transcript_7728/m.47943 type:complete len:434 (+) Transcript_7728:1629-2930(+)